MDRAPLGLLKNRGSDLDWLGRFYPDRHPFFAGIYFLVINLHWVDFLFKINPSLIIQKVNFVAAAKIIIQSNYGDTDFVVEVGDFTNYFFQAESPPNQEVQSPRHFPQPL